MSIFSFLNNYSKPGEGVSKNTAEKKPFFKFWEIFFRKFWSLISLNLTFVLCMIPFLIISFLIFSFLRASSWSIVDNISLTLVFTFSPFMFFGPFVAAIQKITRDFSREISTFVWVDFFTCIKKNFVQPLVMSILGYIVFSALFIAIPTYYYSDLGIMSYVLFGVCIFALILFLFMQYYLYTMAVTFDLKLRELYKNAAILSTVTFIRNFIITLVLVAYLAVIVIMLLFTASINFLFPLLLMFFLLIGFSLFSFVVSFLNFPVLKKYIIDPYYNSNKDQTEKDSEVTTDDDLKPLSDYYDNEEKTELPEYIYHNGRMVHRSVLESENIFDDDIDKNE